nr:hypothetical protein [Cohnella thermotolerans]
MLEEGADLILVSVGALGDDKLREKLFMTARSRGRRIIVPSAAIGGLDRIAAAGFARLDIAVHYRSIEARRLHGK